MIELFRQFAASSEGPAVHVAPGEVFNIGGLSITNSILYGWICAVFICVLLIWVARQITVKPKGGLIQFIEVGVEFISNLVVNTFDDKKIGWKYAPFFVTIFFFIILNNWLGLIPIVGEGFKSGENPIFRPFTGDLNGTFAIGAFTMIFVYVMSVREAGGPLKYLRHFFVGSMKNPLFFTIGILEMFTDLTRVISLSLRLFLNVTIGEILIAVFAYLGAVAAPVTALPFYLLELFVAALQAYIFVILSTMYLAIAVNAAGHHDEDLTDDELPETMKVTAPGGAHGHA